MASSPTDRRILAVIPMRAGSTGVSDKNIRTLAGRPLFANMFQTLQKVHSIDRTIVSTDTDRYAQVARDQGADVPFLRPSELADGLTRLHHVMHHALSYFDSIGDRFDAVLSAQATAPLITPETIRALIGEFHRTGCDAIATTSIVGRSHPYLAKTVDPDTGIAHDFFDVPAGVPRYPRQARPELHAFNGAVFLRDRSLLEAPNDATNALGDAPRTLLISDREALNIDTEEDFRLAEFFMQETKPS